MGIVLVVTLTFLVIQRHVHPQSYSEKCADLEFHGFRDGETAKVEEKTYFNVTFYISKAKCTTLPIWFRVKVSYHQANFTVDVCSVIFENQKCEITDRSSYCRCVDDPNDAAQLYREFNMSGNVSYIWSLSDSTSGQIQKKAQIIFDVSKGHPTIHVDKGPAIANVDDANAADPAALDSSPEKVDVKTLERPQPTPLHARTTQRVVQSTLHPVRVDSGDTDVGTTSAGVTDTKSDGVNLQVIFFNSIITACVIGIPVIIVITIYIYRHRKATAAAAAASESQPPTNFRPRPQEPDTTMGIKRRIQTRVRPPSAQEEGEYSEIDYELQGDGTSSMLVHENYEHPLHKEGEDKSEYSRLEYKGLWHSGVRLEPDSKQTKMDVPSPSTAAFTLKELPDDYLEPVPLTADKKT